MTDEQRKEAVRNDIATNVTLGSSGKLEVICPHCGNSQELKEKKTTTTCKYCDRNYYVPEKILSLL
jgi:uncharacterized CHY-type Zn-finger protein